MFVIVGVTLAPLLAVLMMSFGEGRVQTFPMRGFTFRWYGDALANGNFRTAFSNSLQVAIASAVISTVLGFLSAQLVTRHLRRRGLAYGLAVSVPCLIPLLLSGMALLIYYREIGLLGSKVAIVAAHACFASPFAFAVIRNGYLNLNQELELAARNLGATQWQTLARVTVPELLPSLIGASALAFLLSWDEFVLTWYVGGFNRTLPTEIYGALGTAYSPSISAVGSMSMVVSVVVLSIFIGFTGSRARKNERLTPAGVSG